MTSITDRKTLVHQVRKAVWSGRSVARKGSKKASVAVAHTILVIADHLLKHKATYQELGANYFDQQDKERISHRLTKRLEQLGYQVFLEPQPTSSTPA